MNERGAARELAPGRDGPPYRCPVCQEHSLGVKPYESWPPPPGPTLAPPYVDLLGSASYEVCPSCGFEFGFDDNPGTGAGQSFEDYRREWEGQGRPRFDTRS